MTHPSIQDVENGLRNYDDLHLQAKTVIADLMVQVWTHFVTRACGPVAGRMPTAEHFRQYMLDWFNFDIKG